MYFTLFKVSPETKFVPYFFFKAKKEEKLEKIFFFNYFLKLFFRSKTVFANFKNKKILNNL